ncbi:hypothetical protein [Pedobacter suwonensis]|uniref:hypothetical protein n=1 Tax=Pedobacter suwonensis TaxID=332999 RepID=UPI0011A48310|nr:hypothetical protein [Pedobacter suwonensis]
MEQAISSNKAASDWKLDPQKGDVYTGDQVIDAYLTGKKHGLQSYQKSLYNSLQQNVDACAVITKSVLEYLKKINIESDTAFLKINNWDNFNIILPVKEEDFLDEKFLSVYDFASDLEEKSINDTFNFGVSFLDYTEKLNEHNLQCDGFILKFAN